MRIEPVGVLAKAAVVGAGLSGFHGGAADAGKALGIWREALGVRRLSLADDAVTSYLGALGDDSGAVVAAGTGVAVLASSGVTSIRVNGWGPTLGDEGGGYWIGQEGFSEEYPHAREVMASVFVPIEDITAINGELSDGKSMDQALADWNASHADLIERWENIKKD